MPRTSERACTLASIDDAIESAACAYLLPSDDDYNENKMEDDIDDANNENIEDLLAMRDTVAAF